MSKEFKIWRATFHNEYSFTIMAQSRKETIDLLSSFYISLKSLKSLHLSKDYKDLNQVRRYNKLVCEVK